jgi:GT2 family glycosyltransferase
MELSIVIVNWNSTPDLINCFNSIIKNINNIEYEIIVADNYSDDFDSPTLKKNYPMINFIINEKNFGYSKANNQCAKKAKGNYILFLNPDITLTPACAKTMIDFLNENKEAGAVSGKFLNHDGSLQRFYRRFPTVPYMIGHATCFTKLFPDNKFTQDYEYRIERFENITEVDQPGTSLFMIRHQLFSEIGGFDEQLPIFFNDADLCKRIYDKGYKIYILPEAKAYHLMGASIKKEDPEVIILEGALSLITYLKKHRSHREAILMKSIILFDQALRFIFGLVLFILGKQSAKNFNYRLKVFFYLLINKRLRAYG